MSNIVHDKYHRQNHHSFITSAITDMGLDPLASKELPFSGEFVMDNADHNDWLLSSDRAAFEWVSGYNNTDSLKFDVDISGAIGKTIIYPSGEFGNVVIANGRTDVPSLSVVGKSIFTNDIIHDGTLTVSTINTTGISAGNVLISGNNGFALNVTNGLSKFNDVTGGDFTITGNTEIAGNVVVGGGAEIGGDLNVNENLYFTSGIANGGFLNVAGSAFFHDIKVVNKIEAKDYYFERTTGINIPEGGGWKLSGTLSDEEKPLIPGKDSGAVSYDPGINNMTLSAVGLSSDSWVSFGGNLLVDGDRVYDEAGLTTFNNTVRFNGNTSALYLSGGNGIFTELSGKDVQFEDGSAFKFGIHTLNVASASAEYIEATGVSGTNISACNLDAHLLTLDDMLFRAPATHPILSETFQTANGLVTINQNENWNSGLISAQNVVSDNFVIAAKANRTSRPDYAYDSDDYKVRVPNIGFCDSQYSSFIKQLSGNTGFESDENVFIVGPDDSAQPRYLPYDDTKSADNQPPCNIRTDEEAITWYNAARSRIYVIGNHSGHVHRGVLYLNQHHLYVNRAHEFCFDFYMITDGNCRSVGSMFYITLRKTGSMDTEIGALRLGDMYGPSGKKISLSELRMGNSGTVRTILRVHFVPRDYAIVEVLGAFNGTVSGTDGQGWFT